MSTRPFHISILFFAFPLKLSALVQILPSYFPIHFNPVSASRKELEHEDGMSAALPAHPQFQVQLPCLAIGTRVIIFLLPDMQGGAAPIILHHSCPAPIVLPRGDPHVRRANF